MMQVDIVFVLLMGPFLVVLWTFALMLLWTLWKYRGDLLALIDSLPSGLHRPKAPPPPKPPEFDYTEHLKETRSS